jgi:hypothetical protein
MCCSDRLNSPAKLDVQAPAADSLLAETRLVVSFRAQGERPAAAQGGAAPISLGARRQDTRLRGLPGQQAVHQRRQCRRQRPCRPHTDGLPEPLASQDLRARGIERPRRVLLLDAQVAGAFFRRGPCFGGARLAARGTAALDVEQFLLIGRQTRPHLPQLSIVLTLGTTA